MKIIGIAGFKNSGKTTLVTDLIRELTGRGLCIATIKHAHHDFDIDHEGKDSFLHRAAGASQVIVASTRRWAQITELGHGQEPSLRNHLMRLDNADIVLVEGYKHGDHPKLEVRRAALAHPPLAGPGMHVIGIVADTDLADEVLPVLRRDAVPGIADFVIANAVEFFD
jgi:molybdopterin-guanine dinucleotide biosynthesis protein B